MLTQQPQHGLSRPPLQVGEFSAAAYRELSFHSALVRAAGNGLLLGTFVDNRLASGVKYAAGLTGVTLAAFLPFVRVGFDGRFAPSQHPPDIPHF